jgi:hypothetical protein
MLVPLAGVLVIALAGLLISGCGGSKARSTSTASQAHHAQQQAPAAAKGGTADATELQVIRDWSNALRRGDVHAAARYFALPSTYADGTDPPVRIHNLSQALFVNAALPCGAKLISTHRLGPYVNALFLLTGRPGPGGTNCGTGAGQTARTNFLIRSGRIVAWIRAPDEPGDNKGSQGSSGGGPAI